MQPIGLMWLAVIENQYLGDTMQTLCDGQYLQCRLRHLGLVFLRRKTGRKSVWKIIKASRDSICVAL